MYTASITPIYQIKAPGSQTRGEAKEKTKSFIETMYGFESGHSKKTIAANRRLAEELKNTRRVLFTWSVYSIHLVLLPLLK